MSETITSSPADRPSGDLHEIETGDPERTRRAHGPVAAQHEDLLNTFHPGGEPLRTRRRARSHGRDDEDLDAELGRSAAWEGFFSGRAR